MVSTGTSGSVTDCSQSYTCATLTDVAMFMLQIYASFAAESVKTKPCG
jgi:hypothetical protein